MSAPIEIRVAPLAALPRAEIAISGERSGEGACTLLLTGGVIEKSSPGCYLDSRVGAKPGTLIYPCSGNGSAEASFAEDHYTGRLEDGKLTLERSTELDWEDGCRWGTRAVLEGSLPSAPTPAITAVLTWSYADRVVRGGDCSGTCRAHTSVGASPPPSSRPSTKTREP